MSLRALPLMVVPLILYNIVVVFAGGGPATGPLQRDLVQADDAQAAPSGHSPGAT